MRAGVDEAGRGPVLGPLVVAAVAADEKASLPKGVGDSKRIAPATRTALAAAIRSSRDVRVAVRVVHAAELDEGMVRGSLNDIEAVAFADVLREVGASRAVVDTVGPGPAFARRLTALLGGACAVEARPRADATDPFVGAASIVAKVVRDAEMVRIGEELGCALGSGYCSDPRTQDFLETWRAHHPTPPPHARREWATITRLAFGTRSLSEFDDGGR